MSEAAPTTSNIPEFSVSEISNTLKRTVEEQFSYVKVRGEISGLKQAASGHVYYSLKDDKAVLNAICWKGVAANLPMKLEDGLEVVVSGKLSTYPGRSNYQIIAEWVEPAGVGALMALLEKRKKMLAEEGLFDADRKQAIPYLPRTIGVVTSPTGAVIRDILHRITDRFPGHVLVWPVLVQGDGAAEQITSAIEGFNMLPEKPDLLIVARGGGSLEDLWAFNEENVVRAVAKSNIPVISAVGHETDTTLIDFVSDRRAPTPTAAAEMAVPVKADLVSTILHHQERLFGVMKRYLDHQGSELNGLSRALITPKQMLEMAMQKLDDMAERLPLSIQRKVQQMKEKFISLSSHMSMRAIQQNINNVGDDIQQAGQRMQYANRMLVQRCEDRLNNVSKLLESYHYENVLKRGYAMVKDVDGNLIASKNAASQHESMQVQFADGSIKVSSGKSGGVQPKKASSKKAAPKDQGSLF